MSTQESVDNLITIIENAEEAESITNEMVATVFDHLNEKCKANENSSSTQGLTIKVLQSRVAALTPVECSSEEDMAEKAASGDYPVGQIFFIPEDE